MFRSEAQIIEMSQTICPRKMSYSEEREFQFGVRCLNVKDHMVSLKQLIPVCDMVGS